MRWFQLGGLIGATLLAACAADPTSPPEHEPLAPTAPVQVPRDPLFDDPASFDPLPPTGPDGWRAVVSEPGQTYVDFLGSVPRRPTPQQQLYLLPLTELGTAFVVDAEVTYIVRTPAPEDMATVLSVFFDVPAEVLPTVPLAEVAEAERIRRGHEQYRAQTLLSATAEHVPQDAYSMTTLMVHDVFFDDTQSYGYGFGQHVDGQAVVSFARLDPAVSGLRSEDDVLERLPLRAFKLLVHEVGHTFGFEHCTEHRCVMNGMADLAELDATPLHLGPGCLRKLLHVREFDPAQRYAELAALYGRLGLEAPAQWTQARHQRLREPARPARP